MSSGNRLTGLDGMFANTNIVLLILFGICCNPISLILGILGLLLCGDPLAKKNALIVTVISGVLFVAGLVAQLSGAIQNVQR